MPDDHDGDTPATSAEREPPGVLVALATRERSVALTLGHSQPWEGAPGVRLAPLTLPAADAVPGDGCAAALAMGARTLGYDLEPIAGPWRYGPSERRAMDRVAASAQDAPFLRYIRFDARRDDPASEPRLSPPIRVRVEVYLARAIGPARAMDGETVILWAPLSALRAAVGGLWFGALLALDGVSLARPSDDLARYGSPDELFVFTPALAGERQLLRACAKYGEDILFPAG